LPAQKTAEHMADFHRANTWITTISSKSDLPQPSHTKKSQSPHTRKAILIQDSGDALMILWDDCDSRNGFHLVSFDLTKYAFLLPIRVMDVLPNFS
jgi:hypothetical protein